MITRTLTAAAVCCALVGCATPSTSNNRVMFSNWGDRVQALIKSGQCSEAHKLINGGPTNIGDHDFKSTLMMLHSLAYAGCDRDKNKAIAYATLSARYGNQDAQRFLVDNGAPVPSADLKAVEVADRSATAAQTAADDAAHQRNVDRVVKAWGGGETPQPPQPINCTSTKLGTMINTSCY